MGLPGRRSLGQLAKEQPGEGAGKADGLGSGLLGFKAQP